MADIQGFITPNATVTVFKGVKWDSNHTNAFYFTSKSQLDGYLDGLSHYTYNNMSYVRTNQNSVKIRDNEGHIFGSNYLRIDNSSNLGFNHSIYCFITDTQYENNNCVTIHYEVDYLTTFWLDIAWNHCYVVREHTATDKAGENIQPEPVSMQTQCIYETKRSSVNQKSGGTGYYGYGVVIASTISTTGEKGKAKVYYDNEVQESVGSFQGIFQGLYLYVYGTFSISIGLAQNCISDILDKADGNASVIKYVMIVPMAVLNAIKSGGVFYDYITVNVPTSLGRSASSNYTPRNKKLYTYPYTYFTLTGGNTTAPFHFEDFANFAGAGSVATFTITGGSLYTDSTLTAVPANYENYSANYSQGISLQPYPQMAWSESYKDTGGTIAGVIGTALGIATTIAGVATENPALIGSGISATVQSGAGAIVAATKENVASGGNSTALQSLVNQSMEFFIRVITPTAEDAKRIDDFFTMYGYAVNETKVPTFHNRPHYTYTQLATVNFTGVLPDTARKNITEIMQRGVTFWVNAENIGNYNLNNQPS